jgi:hypothetical protein
MQWHRVWVEKDAHVDEAGAVHIEAARGGVGCYDGHAKLGRLALDARLLDDVLVVAGQATQIVDDLQPWRHRYHHPLSCLHQCMLHAKCLHAKQ